MSKFKIEYGAGQKFLVIQAQKGQQISQREYYAISNGLVPGLLRAQMFKKGNTFKLSYNISGFISLKDFLVNPLNKQSFARLLSNILNNLKALQAAYYNHQFILMDMEAAMVNPTTQQVSFVYVPITFYDSGTNLKEFLLSIIQRCSFAPGENTDYVREYIRILNSGINFSIFDLEEYIKSLNADNAAKSVVKKCTHCGSPLPPNVNFCSACGMKISISNVSNPQGVYDPSKNVVKPSATENNSYVQSQTQSAHGNTGFTTQHVHENNVVNAQVQNPVTMQGNMGNAQPFVPSTPVNNIPASQPQVPPQYSGTISASCVSEVVNQPSVNSVTQNGAVSQSDGQVNAVQPPEIPAIQTTKAYIYRVKTGEQTPISANPFRIGKDPFNCEYCVRDNSAISRCHALIKQINNKWIINDLNSTNKTYLNEQMIHPNMDVELHNGMKIKFANEDFIFNLY